MIISGAPAPEWIFFRENILMRTKKNTPLTVNVLSHNTNQGVLIDHSSLKKNPARKTLSDICLCWYFQSCIFARLSIQFNVPFELSDSRWLIRSLSPLQKRTFPEFAFNTEWSLVLRTILYTYFRKSSTGIIQTIYIFIMNFNDFVVANDKTK